MTYEIRPFEGAGPISFGMDKIAIHATMGAPNNTFRRGPFAKGDTEMYADCFVNYDADGKCETIEFFSPACVMFDGKNIMACPCDELRQFLSDGEIEDMDEGFCAKRYGITAYAPYEYDEPDCIPESIGAYIKGYYD